MLDPQRSAHTRQSLYKRLGGYDTIAAVVHELMPRLKRDPIIGPYWKGKSEDSARREDQLAIDFICAAFEGPVYYAGRDMRTAHKGLGITEEEWSVFMDHLAATLDHLAIPAHETSEFLDAAAALKWDVVDMPAKVVE
jgi:hemoglobin